MEPYSKILEAIEKNGDPASALVEIEQEINEIPHKIEVATAELASLREEENSYNANLPNYQAALNAANSHLATLSKSDLNEIRSLARPAKTVERVAQGVLILFGINSLSWDAFRKFLGDRFMENLTNFDVHNIQKKKIEDLKPIIDEFQGHEDQIRNVSHAAYGLYMWVFGVYQVYQLLHQFRPIGQIRTEINEKSQEIADLQQKLLEAPIAIEVLKEKIDKMNNP